MWLNRSWWLAMFSSMVFIFVIPSRLAAIWCICAAMLLQLVEMALRDIPSEAIRGAKIWWEAQEKWRLHVRPFKDSWLIIWPLGHRKLVWYPDHAPYLTAIARKANPDA